ncbi:MAG: hypothetical protein FWE15_04720 [Actinomycetia bacterium]|nr:hypothetical protein [Actinomycetes bacterium]
MVRPLDPDSPVPLYEQLAQDIRDRISSGELTKRLPSLVDLSLEYIVTRPDAGDTPVSRDTAQKAMQTLADEGTAIRSRGRGYWVAKRD